MTRKTWGFEVGGSGFAVSIGRIGFFVGAALLLVPALPSFARTNGDDVEADPIGITVMVINQAPLTPEDLAKALEETTLVFGRVGVETQWVLCGSSVEESAKPDACTAPLAPGEFALRIVPDPKGMPSTSRDALGLAMVVPKPRYSFLASLFYDRVEAFAEQTRCPRMVVLGHAIAHELGHLLLGTLEHSSHGVMRAHWNREDLRLAERRSFRFVPQQAEQIRAGLRARLLMLTTRAVVASQR